MLCLLTPLVCRSEHGDETAPAAAADEPSCTSSAATAEDATAAPLDPTALAEGSVADCTAAAVSVDTMDASPCPEEPRTEAPEANIAGCVATAGADEPSPVDPQTARADTCIADAAAVGAPVDTCIADAPAAPAAEERAPATVATMAFGIAANPGADSPAVPPCPKIHAAITASLVTGACAVASALHVGAGAALEGSSPVLAPAEGRKGGKGRSALKRCGSPTLAEGNEEGMSKRSCSIVTSSPAVAMTA